MVLDIARMAQMKIPNTVTIVSWVNNNHINIQIHIYTFFALFLSRNIHSFLLYRIRSLSKFSNPNPLVKIRIFLVFQIFFFAQNYQFFLSKLRTQRNILTIETISINHRGRYTQDDSLYTCIFTDIFCKFQT